MIHLSYSISPDRRVLTILADTTARAELQTWPTSAKETAETGGGWGPIIHTDRAMYEVFERLICNSELQWISPEVCGDLTDAPILGIYGDERAANGDEPEYGTGTVCTGRAEGILKVRAVLERWAYLDYQIRSVLVDLLEKGEAIFTAP